MRKMLLIFVILISVMALKGVNERQIGFTAGENSLLLQIAENEGYTSKGGYSLFLQYNKSKRWNKELCCYVEFLNFKGDEYTLSHKYVLVSLLMGYSWNYYNSETVKFYSGLDFGVLTINGKGLLPDLNLKLLGIESKKTGLFIEFNAVSKSMCCAGMKF